MRFQITGIAEYNYVLVLNPMMGGIEGGAAVLSAPTLGQLKSMYDAEKVDHYTDEDLCHYEGGKKSYSKTFRKGGALEWYNPLNEKEIDWNNEEGSCNYFGHGIHLQLVQVTNVQRQFKLY